MQRKLIIALIVIIAGTVSFLFAQQLGKKWSGRRMAAMQEKRDQEISSHPHNRKKLFELVRNQKVIGMDINTIKESYGEPDTEKEGSLYYKIKTNYSILFGQEQIYVCLSDKNSKVTKASYGDW